MNQVKGAIVSIETAGDISLVTMAANGGSFCSLVIDTPETASYLQIGREVVMVFKEMEMSIAKGPVEGLSLRNHFPATVTQVEMGTLLSNVYLDFGGISLVAVITSRSVKALQLRAGDEVVGLVKTNEISLTETYL